MYGDPLSWPRTPREYVMTLPVTRLGQTDDDYVTRVAYDYNRGMVWADTGVKLTQAELDRYWTVMRARGLPAGASYIVRQYSPFTQFMPNDGGGISLPDIFGGPAAPTPTTPIVPTAGALPLWVWIAGAAGLGLGLVALVRR